MDRVVELVWNQFSKSLESKKWSPKRWDNPIRKRSNMDRRMDVEIVEMCRVGGFASWAWRRILMSIKKQ